jgi:hypothetical protein
MSRMRAPVWVLVVSLLGWAGIALAQNVQSGGEGLSIKGFINMTGFLQNQNFTFGNGQNAEFPNPPQTRTHRWFLDGDVRNTRVTLGWTGPKLDNGWKLGATLEGDFFGGFNGTGAFSNAQQTPRLRLAYVDLVRAKTTIRIGENWAPLFGTPALSYSHIAFPLGLGSGGHVGWRFPGVTLYQDLTRAGSSVSSKFTLGVFRNTWNGPGNNIDSGSAGPASALPQIEARLDWSGKSGGTTWNSYVVGHVDQKNLAGAGAATRNNLTGWAGEVGGKVTPGAFMIQGNAYAGKAIGQQFGQITQFGDIKSWGAWAQGGYNFTKRWAGYVFVGIDKPKKGDVLAAKMTRVKNQQIAPSLMYNLGPYGFNVEWLHDRLTTAASTGAETTTNGDQIAASVIYKF